jgi:hypothetical protein
LSEKDISPEQSTRDHGGIAGVGRVTIDEEASYTEPSNHDVKSGNGEVILDASKYKKSQKPKSITKPNSISPITKNDKATKKRKEVSSKVYEISKPKLVK